MVLAVSKKNSMLNLISLERSFTDVKITMVTEGKLNAQPCLFQDL